uniref:Uncharacterized protein n=1 Tax=Branchiostoma floridae TaxID=7739 RepID=C3YQN1_BRAFL|eukprot:XP_002601375.1 hypothetical protein BRAFLDRAFT_82683 [Branchiostoma floridae]
MTWSLHRLGLMASESATLVVEVPKFLFCAWHNTQEISFGWMFESSNNMPPYNIEVGISPGRSCGVLDRFLNRIPIQAPVVVLATEGSLVDRLTPETLEQCRQVWEYDGGITVSPAGSPIFRLASMAKTGTGNSSFGGVAFSFVQAQDTNLRTTTVSEWSHTTQPNSTHDNITNITCILITENEHSELFFTAPPLECQTNTTPTTYSTDTNSSSILTNSSEHTGNHYTSSEPGDNSTLQVSTTLAPEVPPTADHVLIPVVVSTVVSLVVLSLAVLAWKLCSTRINYDHGMVSNDAHIWTIPPGVAFPGLFRSASLPAFPSKMAPDDVASCRSLPAVLGNVEPIYCEVPENMVTGQEPLPHLPQPYGTSSMVRSVSLPLVSCKRRGAACDLPSIGALPAVPHSTEPTYSEIPDHIAAAQRPLPAPPHTHIEIQDYDEILPMPLYDDTADFSLQVSTNREQDQWESSTTSSSSSQSESSFAIYGLSEQTQVQPNRFYRMTPEVQGKRTRRNPRSALVSRPDQGLRTYVNVRRAISARDQRRRFLPYVTLPNTYWPWEILGEGTDDKRSHSSLPHVIPPNTYWPWELPGEETRNTPRRPSLPDVTLPNTYWPWELPGQETQNTPRHTSLPLVTLPNTYWPWEIPTGEGTHDTPRRASLPLVTPPNTYWPWEIPMGEGTHDTPRRSSFPHVTLPNTYWPWELPVEGTRNTTRRPSLPYVTLPNTY